MGGEANQLFTHAKLYGVADKYDVTGLKELCKVKFDLACRRYWNDPTFPTAAYHVFSTTPEKDKRLRDVVCKTISKNMSLLKDPAIETLMKEVNGLAFGLLMEKAEEHEWM